MPNALVNRRWSTECERTALGDENTEGMACRGVRVNDQLGSGPVRYA